MTGARIVLTLAYEMREKGLRARPGHALHLRRPGHGDGARTGLRRSRRRMVNAVVLIQCEIDSIAEAAEAIAGIDGVSEVYSVAGEWDLVAIIRVTEHEDLARVIPGGRGEGRGRRTHRDPDRVPGVFEARPRGAVLRRLRRTGAEPNSGARSVVPSTGPRPPVPSAAGAASSPPGAPARSAPRSDARTQNVSAGTSSVRTISVSSSTPNATMNPISVSATSGSTPSTENVPASTKPADVITPPVTASAFSMPGRVPASASPPGRAPSGRCCSPRPAPPGR